MHSRIFVAGIMNSEQYKCLLTLEFHVPIWAKIHEESFANPPESTSEILDPIVNKTLIQ